MLSGRQRLTPFVTSYREGKGVMGCKSQVSVSNDKVIEVAGAWEKGGKNLKKNP